MAFKDDLVKSGVYISEANVLANHDLKSALTTTQIAALPTTALPSLTTTDLPTLTTTQLGVLNNGLASLGAITAAIAAQS